MAGQRSKVTGHQTLKKWFLFLGAMLAFSVDLGQSRPPSSEIEGPFGRALWMSKAKRTRGGFSSPRSSMTIPTVTPDSDEPTDISDSMAESDESVGGGGVVQQWLEMDTVPPTHVSAKLHAEVVLECVAIGSPPPMVFWLKDGKAVENLPVFDSEELLNGLDAQVQSTLSGFAMAKTKSQLRLRCIRPEDEGEYSCVAAQIDGLPGTGPRRLTSASTVAIEEDDKSQDWKPECEFRLPQFMFHGKKGRRGTPAYVHVSESLHMEVIGNSIVLPCRAGGKPKPRTQWYGSDGEPIVTGKKYQINAKGDLVIRNLSWHEMGDYSCHVLNSYGSETATTFLYPLLPEDR